MSHDLIVIGTGPGGYVCASRSGQRGAEACRRWRESTASRSSSISREHPPPHFHAVSAEYRAQIEIASLTIINGHLPPAKLQIVLDWASSRQEALLEAWNAVQAKQAPETIE